MKQNSYTTVPLHCHSYNSHSLRCITINKETWVSALDLSLIVDMESIHSRTVKFNEREKILKAIPSHRGNQWLSFLSAEGVSRLLLSSKLPKAAKVYHWLTTKVFPVTYEIPKLSRTQLLVQLAQFAIDEQRNSSKYGGDF